MFTYSSSLPRKLSAAVITSKQTFKGSKGGKVQQKSTFHQIHLGNNCLEMLRSPFVQPAFMLEIFKKQANKKPNKQKTSGLSTSLPHRSLSTTFELDQHLFSRLTKFFLVSVYPFFSIAQVFLLL